MRAAPLASAPRTGGEFLSDAALVPTGEYRLPNLKRRPEFTLAEPIVFEIGGAGSGLQVVVPAGYVTDGYSLPGMALQLFQPRSANYLLPSILHDWLYDAGLVPRAMADRILLQAMRAVKVAAWQRGLVYTAVRLGGGGGFNRPLPINLEIVRKARTLGAGAALLAYLREITP